LPVRFACLCPLRVGTPGLDPPSQLPSPFQPSLKVLFFNLKTRINFLLMAAMHCSSIGNPRFSKFASHSLLLKCFKFSSLLTLYPTPKLRFTTQQYLFLDDTKNFHALQNLDDAQGLNILAAMKHRQTSNKPQVRPTLTTHVPSIWPFSELRSSLFLQRAFN
jgi:hypothetical protein